MNSLRSQITLGVALVAIVPLAIVLFVFGRRFQRSVDAQSEARLAQALDRARSQLDADAQRLSHKLELLAADPELKRLYLVDAERGPALRELLARQQFLLDLDVLAVVDTGGRAIAEGAPAPFAASGTPRPPVETAAIEGTPRLATRLALLAPGHGLVMLCDAPVRYRDEIVGVVRGGLVLDSTAVARLGRTAEVELVLFDATQARRVGMLAVAIAPPADATVRVDVAGRAYLARSAALGIGDPPHATLAAFVSTAASDDAIAALRVSAGLLGGLGLLIAVMFGALWSRQVSRPVERLAAFSTRIARGDWNEPLAVEGVRELRELIDALERMRADLRSARERLGASERQAAYGQMARKVAHEIKNPLTPIAISIADLQRSYDQQRPEFGEILAQASRTIGEEVQRLKALIQSFSEFGRLPAPNRAPFDARDVLSSLRSLLASEAAAGRLRIEAPPAPLALVADRHQIEQALLNLVQNGLDASAPAGTVTLLARGVEGAIELDVSDDGPGLSEEQRAMLFVPGFTTKTHGSGLGLTIVEKIVSDHGGTIAVESRPDHGTTFRVHLPSPSERPS